MNNVENINELIETYKILMDRNNPDKSRVCPDDYKKHCTNSNLRSILPEIAFMCGFDIDGDTVTIQRHTLAFDCSRGLCIYTRDNDKISDKTFICKCKDDKNNIIEIIVFAETIYEVLNLIRSRMLCDCSIGTGIKVNPMTKVSESGLLPNTSISLDNIDINEYTDKDLSMRYGDCNDLTRYILF